MSIKINSSLRNVPRLIFEHFANIESVQHGQFSAYDGEHFVSLAFSKKGENEPNKPFTLACLDQSLLDGQYGAELRVYNYPAKLEQFKSDYDKYAGEPVMIISLRIDSPARNSRTWDKWQKGRGFWIEEHLEVNFGSSHPAEITSKHGSWEFEFFLELQSKALELVRSVPITGHWESEWNPDGEYTKKP